MKKKNKKNIKTPGIRSKYPIADIERDFVMNRIWYHEINDKYGTTDQLLAYYSKKLNWREKRKRYYRKFIERSKKEIEKEKVKEEVKYYKTKRERIEALRNLMDLKVNAEMKVFLQSLQEDDLKTICHYINKSKDSVTDLAKIIELLEGNATDRLDVTDEERIFRANRLTSLSGIEIEPSKN